MHRRDDVARRLNLRARLEAIARGETGKQKPGVIEPGVVATHHAAFGAWARFARQERGEPLTAPAEILAPLP